MKLTKTAIILLVMIPMILVACGSGQTKDAKADLDDSGYGKVSEMPADVKKHYDKFMKIEPHRQEVFRVFATSDYYERQQISQKENIQIKKDPLGDQALSEDLKKYDKVDYYAQGLVWLELYPDSGKISRVRFLQPSGIGELDKVMADDITRWKLEFPKDIITPSRLTVRFAFVLQNRLSREEAMKELKKFAN